MDDNSATFGAKCDQSEVKDSYVLMDRDGKFTSQFQAILRDAGVDPKLLPAKSPNCNAFLERFFLSIKSETLERMIFFSEASLCRAVNQYLSHYHTERFHQGLGHRLIEAGPEAGRETGVLQCRERLGGILKYYFRQAA